MGGDHRRHPHRHHRHPQRGFVDGLPVVAYAAAGDQPRVPQLHRGAQPLPATGRQRVDGDDGGAPGGLHRAPQKLQRLHACGGQYPRRQRRNRREPPELPGQRPHHVPRHQQALQRQRPHRVGGHAPVAQARHQHRPVLPHAGQQRPQLAGQTPRRTGKEPLLPAEIGPQINGHVPALRLAYRLRRLLRGDAHIRHAVALPGVFRRENAVQP